jgi:hypothetical protein
VLWPASQPGLASLATPMPGSIQIEISGRLGALIGEKAFPHGI